MNHARTLDALPDLLMARLDEVEAARVWEHLAACTQCEEARLTLELLSHWPKHVHQNRMFLAHPEAADIVDFALAPDGLPDEARERMSGHLQECSACRREVDTVKKAEARHPEDDARVPRRLGTRHVARASLAVWLGVAAALLTAAVLIRPGWFGRATPDDRPMVVGGDAVNATRGAAVGLTLLRSPTRGFTEQAVVHMGPEQELLVVGVEVGYVMSASADAILDLEVLEVDGKTTWSHSLPLDVARAQAAPSGVLALVVPGRSLRPGLLRLEMHVRDGDARRVLASIPFQLKRNPVPQSGLPTPMNAPQ